MRKDTTGRRRSAPAVMRQSAPVVALLSATVGSVALADQHTWTGGGGNTNWTTAGNWSSAGGGAPIPGDTVVFNGTTTNSTLLQADFSIGGLTLNSALSNDVSIANGSGSRALTLGSGGIVMQNNSRSLTISASTVALSAAQTWTNSNASTSRVLTVSSPVNNNGYVLAVAGASYTVISGAISGTGALTTGASRLTLSNSGNTYSGDTTVSGGTLRIGAPNAIPSGAGKGNVVVSNGATLDLFGNSISVNGLSGNGLVDYSPSIGTATLSVGYNDQTSTFAGMITNTGGGSLALTKTGAGTLTLSGSNAYTGTTTISAGTLVVSGGVAIDDGGLVSLADATGATLQLNSNETIGSLSGGGAAGGNVTLQANTLSVGGSVSNSYGGVISGTGGLTRSGSGTQILTSANTYSGLTTVSAGVLNIQNGRALGDTAAGTTVSSGAALQIQNDITVGNEALALNGMGVNNDGALRNVSGNNVWQGTVTLGGASRINSDSGTLVLSAANSVVGTDQNLTLGGAGSGTVTGIIATGAGALIKDGAGTWMLSGANTYTGVTTINAGVLNIRHATALGAVANGTTVADGAALQIQNDVTVGNEALTLNGTGISNDGALRNVSGNNIWQGTVTLGGSSRINSDAGTLTLSAANSVTASNRDLTLGGAGAGTMIGTITTGTGRLTKDGVGRWSLCGANTYTGATAVNAGTLALNGGSLAGTAVTVGTASANATLQVSGDYTIGSGAAGSLTLAGGNGSSSGGTLSMVDGAINTLTLSNTTTTATVLKVGGTTATDRSILNLEVGATADRITVTSGKVLIQAGLANINIVGLGGLSGTTQMLISGGGASGTQTFAQLAAGATLTTSGNFGGRTVSLGSTSSSLTLNESAPAPAPAVAYWKGTNDGNWNSFTGGNSNITNWATDAAGANATQIPDGSSNVYFSVTGGGANPGTALGQDFAINSLTFTASADAAHQVTIGGGSTLTINATSANGNNGGVGITVAPGAGNQIVSSKVALGNGQTWAVTDAGSTLTVSNEITGTGKDLTKAGAGTLILRGANTYTGVTTISGGTLLVTGTGSIATSSMVKVMGGTLEAIGTGKVGAMTISTNGVVAPGTGSRTFGSLTTGPQKWIGGTYGVDIGSSTAVAGDGVAGTNWDLLTMSALDAASTSLRINVTGTSMDFGKAGVYDWLIAQTGSGRFDTSTLYLSVSGFGVTAPPAWKFSLLTGDMITGTNASRTDNRHLYLQYTYSAVPEATTLLLGSAGMALILTQRRSRHTGRRGRISVM